MLHRNETLLGLLDVLLESLDRLLLQGQFMFILLDHVLEGTLLLPEVILQSLDFLLVLLLLLLNFLVVLIRRTLVLLLILLLLLTDPLLQALPLDLIEVLKLRQGILSLLLTIL